MRPDVQLIRAPRAVTLRMGWQRELKAPNKVLAALVTEGGEADLTTLSLLTGVRADELDDVVSALCDKGWVRRITPQSTPNESAPHGNTLVRLTAGV